MAADQPAWWSVRLEAMDDQPYDQARLLDLLDRLAEHDAVVTGSPERPLDGRPHYGARLSVRASDPLEAAARARELFLRAAGDAGLPDWPLARAEIVSERDLEAELAAASFPELYGVAELAERLGVSRQRAGVITARSDFPRPVATLRATPVWTAESVARFLASWPRKAGRPAGARAG